MRRTGELNPKGSKALPFTCAALYCVIASRQSRRPMSVKVKIAPFERWCEGARAEFAKRQDSDACEGLTVEIETNTSAWWPYCAGRAWYITQKTHDELRRRNQREPVQGPAAFCEHMLELGD